MGRRLLLFNFLNCAFHRELRKKLRIFKLHIPVFALKNGLESLCFSGFALRCSLVLRFQHKILSVRKIIDSHGIVVYQFDCRRFHSAGLDESATLVCQHPGGVHAEQPVCP